MKVRMYPLKLDTLSATRRDHYLDKHSLFKILQHSQKSTLSYCLVLIVWFICIFIKKRFQHRCFSLEFSEFSKTSIFYTASGCFYFFKPWFFRPHLSSLAAPIASRRSSHRMCSVRKGLEKACNFIKKEALVQVFSCEFCEISKNTFFTEHLWATASDHALNNFPTKLSSRTLLTNEVDSNIEKKCSLQSHHRTILKNVYYSQVLEDH